MERTITVNGVNITANPHPEGIYLTLLRNAARGVARARGSDFAAITSPRRYSGTSEAIFTGRILVWTDIDLRGRWLDLSKQEDLAPDIKNKINIPPNARPNYRTFNYVFVENKHQLWFESKNEENNTIGPTAVRRVISTLIENANSSEEDPEVYVSIIPKEDAVASVLALPNLRTLILRVNRPNADASSPAARQRVFALLDTQHAHRLDMKLTKSTRANKLEPSADTRELAEVAADTGFAKSEARDSDGKKVERSTVDMPKTFEISLAEGSSFVRRLLSAIRII